ncbi:MAG: cell division protein FtsH [Planctomycetota bacterium]
MTASPFTADQIATAYHEAGHAVMALAMGRPVQRVSVLPNQLRLGQCEIQKGSFRPSKDILETEILILLGGPAAEARVTGKFCYQGAAQDLRGVRKLVLRRATGEKQVERLERRMLDKTEHILEQSEVWLAIQKIASELLRCTTISGRAARHLFDEAVSQADK